MGPSCKHASGAAETTTRPKTTTGPAACTRVNTQGRCGGAAERLTKTQTAASFPSISRAWTKTMKTGRTRWLVKCRGASAVVRSATQSRTVLKTRTCGPQSETPTWLWMSLTGSKR